MTALLTDYYKSQLQTLHSRDVMWGSSAGRWRNDVLEMAKELGAKTVLDYGCGKGLLKLGVAKFGYDVREYDPGIPGKDSPPEPADLVACLDVIEHLEPECLDDVLRNIGRLAQKGALLVIALYPSGTKLPDGRDSHLIIEPPAWWDQRLRSVLPEWALSWEHRARPTRNPNRVKDVIVVRMIPLCGKP